MGDSDQTLQILIDVRSRLDEVVKAQAEFRKMREEVTSTGHALKTGLGIELARRGLDLLTSSVHEYITESFRMAEEIRNGARNLEVSEQAYQVLGELIRENGGDMTLFTMAVSANNRSLVEARNVNSAAAGAYRILGLNIAELESIPLEKRFELIGRSVLSAKDRTEAFTAAGHVLGSRHLPTLLGAIKKLSQEGYDELSKSMEKAGRIMSEDTINRLALARTELQKFNLKGTIFAGETIGGAMTSWEALKAGLSNDLPGFFAMLGKTSAENFFMPWRNFTGESAFVKWLAKNAPAAPTVAPLESNGSAGAEIALKEALAKAEFNLAAATLHRQTVESDPNVTDFQKKRHVIQLMEEELALRLKLIDATKATPLEATETQDARDLKVKKLEEQNKQLRDQLNHARFQTDSGDKEQATRDKFGKFQEDGAGGRLNLVGSMGLGAMDWITGLGTQGEQASGALQSSLGATVKGISDGIYGWLTGTQSFGSALAQLGGSVFKTFLDTIVQMGVQWLVTQALMKTGMISTHAVGETLRGARIAGAATEGAATETALAPAAATASISSFGLAAIIGIAALVAAMAIFGGFESGGFTGTGPTSQIAGVVHGQEGVLNAPALRRLGIDNLNRLNAGQSISGAPAAFAGGGSSAGGGGVRESARNIHIYLDRSAWLDAVQNDLSGIAHSVYDKRARA